jgi:hypothetical protein
MAPYFFGKGEGRAVTVTSTRYVEMLRKFIAPELSRCGIQLSTMLFQQDCATTLTARTSLEAVRENFPEHIISLRGKHTWLESSPDLFACDYYLRGIAKLMCTPLDQGSCMI